MAKTKKKKKLPKYVAVPRDHWSDPYIFNSRDALFKGIEDGEMSPKYYNFYEIGNPVKVDIVIIETPLTKKMTKVKGLK